MKGQNTFLEKVWKQRSRYASVIISVLVSFLFVSMSVYGATTVSTNLSTGGTLSVTGLSTLTGFISTASSTVSNTLWVAGAFTASSTLQASGNAFLYGTLGVGATTTLSQEVGLVGDVLQTNTGTTTHILDTTTTGKGSCIQLRTTGGAWVRIYATTTSGYVFLEAGGCQSAN